MGEFKAQILGIILVLGIFATLNRVVPGTFGEAWDAISNQISNTLNPPPPPEPGEEQAE